MGGAYQNQWNFFVGMLNNTHWIKRTGVRWIVLLSPLMQIKKIALNYKHETWKIISSSKNKYKDASTKFHFYIIFCAFHLKT